VVAVSLLSGTEGADLFVLGQGQDSITAGAGRDQFRFLPTAIGPGNSFAFTDFNPADGERLDLSRIDAIAGTLANDAFTSIGTAPFSGTPGELRWQDLGGGMLLVQGNVNADPAADLTITLALAGPVRSSWFVL
jgi:Ca2+-binding RTX toxin-like protein